MAFEHKQVTLILENEEYEKLKRIAEKSNSSIDGFVKNYIMLLINNINTLEEKVDEPNN
jgi:hypothetical protein